DDDEKTPTPTRTQTPAASPTKSPTPTAPEGRVPITIGVLSDLTGPASQAMTVVDMALADIVRYFNENNRTPVAELKVITYDEQYNPSNDIPGYQWLKERGADVILSGLPPVPVSLRPLVDQDKMVMFALITTPDIESPPGRLFAMNVQGEPYKAALLKWIAENDPNFPKGRPAKIGAVGHNEPYAISHQKGMEQYAKAHPDQYEWVAGFLLDWTTVTFGSQVEALKDCDYVFPPTTGFYIPSFIKEYRAAGGKATLLGDDATLAYLGLMVDGAGWEAFDGMIISLLNGWWNDEFELPKLASQLLTEYHGAGAAEATKKQSGISYLGSFMQQYGAVSVISEAINRAGPKNFSPQELYDTATSFKMTYGGGVEWNFTDTKRTAWNGFGVYEADAERQDVFRADPKWYPFLYEP
ncbi:MAG: ABC transporter substrate-binding protein, partial [Chloroflexi bacterium]|nr:ABC transporter substrate-binding protein [Chloroflexota bacterium]